MDDKYCKQCDNTKNKSDFSGRSTICKYCTNQNSIKKREENAILEGKTFKYKPRVEYDINRTSKKCTKCDEDKILSEYYINKKSGDGYTHRCIKCLSRKKIKLDDDIFKICNTCDIKKELIEFPKDDGCRLGYKNKCKSCYSISKKIYRDNREISDEEKVKLKEYQEKYRIENKDIINEKIKKYRIENRDIINEKLKEYYINNKDKFKEQLKQYYINNKEKIRLKNRNYIKNRIKTDIVFKIKENIRTSIGNSFRNNGYTKRSRSYEILGCSFEEFKLHIESKFDIWMTWGNHGQYNGELNYGWDLDHIIPISSAITEEDIIKLNHFTNFQTLCSYINRNIKRDKIDY